MLKCGNLRGYISFNMIICHALSAYNEAFNLFLTTTNLNYLLDFPPENSLCSPKMPAIRTMTDLRQVRISS